MFSLLASAIKLSEENGYGDRSKLIDLIESVSTRETINKLRPIAIKAFKNEPRLMDAFEELDNEDSFIWDEIQPGEVIDKLSEYVMSLDENDIPKIASFVDLNHKNIETRHMKKSSGGKFTNVDEIPNLLKKDKHLRYRVISTIADAIIKGSDDDDDMREICHKLIMGPYQQLNDMSDDEIMKLLSKFDQKHTDKLLELLNFYILGKY